VTSKIGRRGVPWAFTEHGVAMLSSVLHSRTAARVNVEIMRAFVQLRRLFATPGELVEQITKLGETVRLHDDQIKTIAQVLRQMMQSRRNNRRAGSVSKILRPNENLFQKLGRGGRPSTEKGILQPNPSPSPLRIGRRRDLITSFRYHPSGLTAADFLRSIFTTQGV
jgi:hypothetical protein